MNTAEILAHLVGFDTTSANSNLPLIEWVESYLRDLGVASERLADATGTKAGLVARVGPDAAGGVVLCGHTDTVPVTGQPWTREPFTLTREGDRLYGRGTTDMKGFIASSLAAVPAFLAADLQVPVVVALTYDEEIGAFGAPPMAARLAGMPQPAVVVTGEPTSMQVMRAHKGARVLRTTVTGRDCHSSRTDQGASAIMAAARIVTFIEDLAAGFASGTNRSALFEPAYTTMSVGTIHGGQALNIVPRECTIVWEYRCIPGDDADAILKQVEEFCRDDVLPRLRRNAPDADIVTNVVADVPVLDPDRNGAATALLESLGLVASGRAVAYGTDGSAIQNVGIPTVVCGPGNMDQGHQPDEFIELAELDRCDEFLRTLSVWAAGSGSSA